MHFASPLAWWVAVAVAAAIASVAYFSYRRPLVPLSQTERSLLSGLRALVLATLVFFLCRPIVLTPPSAVRPIVAVLVDVSHSMRIADADGRPRIEQATELLRNELLPALSSQFRLELYSVGEGSAATTIDRLGADARQSDLSGALATVRERSGGLPVSGIVILSDGGDTGQQDPAPDGTGPPVFTVGIGSAQGPTDREVVGITAGDARLDQASVDIHVSAVSRRLGRAPFQLRLLADGRLLETRTVIPASEWSPVEEVFTVSPNSAVATVYTAEVAADGSDTIAENNARSVLVSPSGRKRRVLALVGAPGHEFSFMARALARDPGLEIDSIIRKGRNESGKDTFLVQAGAGRAAALTSGFPASREALYAYHALIVLNVDGDFLTRAQLAMVADFVAERGGGLLVAGGRSFAERGLAGTPIEDALPLELNARASSLMRAAFDSFDAVSPNTVVVTAAGETHPVMRRGASPSETRKQWLALPALTGRAALGGPRAGATVLAVTTGPSGAVAPLVAVHRYGRGRSMVFTGEASWRWRMMVPSTDRGYEYFWRQTVRWLATPAPDPVSVVVSESSEPDAATQIEVDVRDSVFAPAADAVVAATLTTPGGESRPLALLREAGASGRFAVALRLDQRGLYRVHVEASHGARSLGSADRWFYVGGADREFADPRLNEGFLRRVARASGGQYTTAEEGSRIVPLLRSAAALKVEPEWRDLWHEPEIFALVVALLSAEWILRRRRGLR